MAANVCFNERVIYLFIQPMHLNGWFIQKQVNWLSLWMGHWIIDSLDSFKNVTPLCVAQRHTTVLLWFSRETTCILATVISTVSVRMAVTSLLAPLAIKGSAAHLIDASLHLLLLFIVWIMFTLSNIWIDVNNNFELSIILWSLSPPPRKKVWQFINKKICFSLFQF